MEADRFALLVGGLPLGPGDLMPGLALGSLGGPWLPEPPITYTIARIVFGLSLLALVMFVLAIPQLFYLASACAVYLNVREQLPGMGTGGMPLGGTPPGAGNSEEKGQKACWLCGSALAHDQSYCPNCKQLQR
jgi:hypothetical protein